MTSLFTRIILLEIIFVIARCKPENGNCQKTLKEVRLIPKYADLGTPGNLKVVFKDNIPLQCGNKISVLDTTNSPTVTYNMEGNCKFYSILMFDPDSRPSPGFLHWLVVNIPDDTMKAGYNKQDGKVIYKYFPSLGATGGEHRYTFFLYCQNKKLNPCIFPKKNVLEKTNFNPREFASSHNLGKLVSLNFYYLNVVGPIEPDVPVVSDLNKKVGNTDENFDQ